MLRAWEFGVNAEVSRSGEMTWSGVVLDCLAWSWALEGERNELDRKSGHQTQQRDQ